MDDESIDKISSSQNQINRVETFDLTYQLNWISSRSRTFFFDRSSKVCVLIEAVRVDTTSRIGSFSCRFGIIVTRARIVMKRCVKTIQFPYRSMTNFPTERWTFLRLKDEKKLYGTLCVCLSLINLKESGTALRKWWWKSLQRVDTRSGYTPMHYVEILFAGRLWQKLLFILTYARE